MDGLTETQHKAKWRNIDNNERRRKQRPIIRTAAAYAIITTVGATLIKLAEILTT
jgi:hypothetical protein